MIFQDPMTSLEPGAPGRRPDRRADPRPREDLQGRRRWTGPSSCWSGSASRARATAPRAYPHEFSGGMRQRVMIAMALSLSPSVLIADEPTTALDVTIQAQILEEIAQLSRETDSGVIFVTHDLGVVADIADRVLVMYAGRVVEQGTLDEIFYDPQHPYTWGLLGSITRMDREPPAPAAGDPRRAAVAGRRAQGLPLPAPLPARVRPAARRCRRSRPRPRGPRPPRPLLARRRARSARGARSGRAHRARPRSRWSHEPTTEPADARRRPGQRPAAAARGRARPAATSRSSRACSSTARSATCTPSTTSR